VAETHALEGIVSSYNDYSNNQKKFFKIWNYVNYYNLDVLVLNEVSLNVFQIIEDSSLLAAWAKFPPFYPDKNQN